MAINKHQSLHIAMTKATRSEPAWPVLSLRSDNIGVFRLIILLHATISATTLPDLIAYNGQPIDGSRVDIEN
jgi:hypothetical protein